MKTTIAIKHDFKAGDTAWVKVRKAEKRLCCKKCGNPKGLMAYIESVDTVEILDISAHCTICGDDKDCVVAYSVRFGKNITTYNLPEQYLHADEEQSQKSKIVYNLF